jgi:hypothetical protein
MAVTSQVLDHPTYIYGLFTEVLDVLWAHVEWWFTGHEECLDRKGNRNILDIVEYIVGTNPNS